jgi:hypothetical protein
MFLRGIIDKRIQKIIRDILNKSIVIIFLIFIDVIINFLRTFFFPSGNFTIDIIIFLDHFCAIVLMTQLVLMVIIESIGDIRKLIKKQLPTLSKSQ